METKKVIYTTAEADYDYGYVQVVDAHVGTATNGKVIRKVLIPAKHVVYQVGRYHSGFHLVADQEQWDKLVEYGLVNFKEERAAQPETD
jgi:hypothetical protein